MSGEVQDFGIRDTDAVTREKHSALDNTPLQTSRHNADQAQLVTSAVGRVCCHGNTQPDSAALRPADDTVSIMLRPVRTVRRLQSKRGSTCLVITVHREQYTYRHSAPNHHAGQRKSQHQCRSTTPHLHWLRPKHSPILDSLHYPNRQKVLSHKANITRRSFPTHSPPAAVTSLVLKLPGTIGYRLGW